MATTEPVGGGPLHPSAAKHPFKDLLGSGKLMAVEPSHGLWGPFGS